MTTGRRLLLLGGAATFAIAAGAIGFGVGRTSRAAHQGAAAPTTTALTPTTLTPTTATPTTALSTTTTGSATTVPVPVTTTVQTGGAGAFAGQWRVHVTLLAVDPTGYAILTWRTYRTCGHDPPPCDIFSGNGIFDGGNASIELRATSATTASGTVLTTTVPDTVPFGHFNARLDPNKDLLYLALPLFTNYPLCGAKADALPIAQQNAQGINCGA